ncbi:MAG: phytanoyl-CoA dioxygenase family protein [Okeania sp. SIO2C2]|uniref:phytanoyl-CoA dioxygenase family protein n=1 Tax=Okeania sp. SIO2C2 TaxID=2607787 RepID=UPI0013B7887C|nr:phytanoyl-CoA dioxygenase family protein [Okeania sp. SIO2C2]NEP89198.1 phytanoyl-CoA dioxygenase family protein [Okeania sp. SIO2C2]
MTLIPEQVKTTRPLTPEQIAKYNEDGFVIIPGFFEVQEIEPIRIACEKDPGIRGQETEFADAQGNISRIAHWTELGDSLLGVIPRLARVVDGSETLLGGECYHWHSKLVQKLPKSKGHFGWHQIYGGVYTEGCLFPDLSACFIAVTANTRENGCVQVIKKSHLMGRIDTSYVGDARLCNLERMEKILERLEVVHCEMEAGDALWFHSNTIHASEGNYTDKPRINLICHHNAVWNEPYKREGLDHRHYIPLQKLPDSTILENKYEGVLENQKFLGKEYGYQQIIRKKDLDSNLAEP